MKDDFSYGRQYVVDRLRCLGFFELADKAARELPEQVETDQLWAWGMRYGLTKDVVISRAGGSP